MARSIAEEKNGGSGMINIPQRNPRDTFLQYNSVCISFGTIRWIGLCSALAAWRMLRKKQRLL